MAGWRYFCVTMTVSSCCQSGGAGFAVDCGVSAGPALINPLMAVWPR